MNTKPIKYAERTGARGDGAKINTYSVTMTAAHRAHWLAEARKLGISGGAYMQSLIDRDIEEKKRMARLLAEVRKEVKALR